MKTVIYWFSGTGNSLSVAKALAEHCEDVELIPMFQCLERPLPVAERIGLVFPVYGWGPPALVARFVEKLSVSSDAYIFSVVTYAGNKGGTLSILRRMLQARHLDLAAGWGVKMPENYPPFGGAPTREKQQVLNQAAAERVQEIVEELQLSPRERFDSSAVVWRVLGRVVYPLFKKHAKGADRSFSVDSACNGCGICAKICPVDNIELVDKRPVWRGNCEQCYACFHWCPQKAVQYGKRSAKQVRYHHPQANLADFVS